MATGISLEEAEIYDELLTPHSLLGDILPPANGDHYDEKKDKMIPKQLNAYKSFREVQLQKQHCFKKQMTLNYHRPFERENIAIDCDEDGQVNEEVLVKTPEVILQMAIYKDSKVIKSKGVLVLGSQTIAEFVDSIDCTMDLALCWENLSDNPMLDKVDWTSKTRASSVIYLGDTLYIDRRSPEHVDYSKEITSFLEHHHGSLQRGMDRITETGDMALTRFSDLKLRLGLPYVYIHQGGCEHLVVVEQIRLFHPGDEPRVENYPRQVFRGGPRRAACGVCNDKFARWVTFNDEEAPSSPCYFCFECYYMLHYTENGEKINEFQGYVYLEGLDDRVGFQVALQKFKSSFNKRLEDKENENT